MPILDALAEQRIRDAVARGELDDLPGAGRPLDLGDDLLVPEDVRIAYRVLKNAGFVPPEAEARRSIAELEALVAGAADDAGRTRALRRLEALRLQLEVRRPGRPALAAATRYRDKLLGRLG